MYSADESLHISDTGASGAATAHQSRREHHHADVLLRGDNPPDPPSTDSQASPRLISQARLSPLRVCHEHLTFERDRPDQPS